MNTIKDILNEAAEYLKNNNIPSARLDSEILLSYILNKDRTYLYINSEDRIQKSEVRRFEELIERRGKREPVSYITGEKEFWSLKFKVTRDTLIPRPETEILVQAVLDIVRGMKDERRRTKDDFSSLVPHPSSLVILDIGTGCGNIAVSLASESPATQASLGCPDIIAVDRSDAALSVAKENAITHRVAERITFLQGDLYSGLQYKNYFDIIVSNPPYIPTGDIETLMSDVRDWEPRGSLDGGKDGLDTIKKIIADASEFLKPAPAGLKQGSGGCLAMEIGFGQAEDVSNIIKATGKFFNIKIVKDLSEIERVVAAWKR